MILVDTSVWIDHFRTGITKLEALLEVGEIASHPFVIGELALGGAKPFEEPLLSIQGLPQIAVASPFDVLATISAADLHGSGIGYVDAHLLASVGAALESTTLWTHDNRLAQVAQRLGLAADLG